MGSALKLREVVLMSVLAVVFGVVYMAFSHLGHLLHAIMGPLGYDIIYGVWFLASIVAAYIIQKPGVAFLAEVIAAGVEMLLGLGPSVLLSGIIQGAGAEAVLAMLRYQNFRLPALMLAGIGSGVASFVYGYFQSGLAVYSSQLLVIMFIVRIVSSAVLAGWLGKWIGDALAKTGALRGYALSKAKNKGPTDHAA
ncbi:ECF transporter S component [Aureibacillus halotolerans]|uniref:Energy-coupling factor transport system substrate-specific component n=1 Tax=Aureibacillus halotolerans TaxID=1508390 RepID=A0A4R6TT94_9BACI|nr:ECF transporter S component [Aureibacillus halotolerans]TDQ34124.1 energy-coupling factor transport system substrate-specific component [Aureibacillus halotolerans]